YDNSYNSLSNSICQSLNLGLTRSFYAKLLAVKQVTSNKGKKVRNGLLISRVMIGM
ncbi:MAG: reverse transcriptase N-terminal domain-containing protein, partial [Deltaproteobacteria bacterium]|nr:reverse transcriptase N-terminal domain-containing protein [Deltaproteobacteria bacterium]